MRNIGGMPTPGRYPVEVSLAASRWLRPRSHVLRLPQPLPPGASHTFSADALVADVADIVYVPRDQPLQETDRVCPLAYQTGANRRFDNLHPRDEFSVAFPAELLPVESLESLTPGQAALLVIGTENKSQAALGRGSQSARIVRLRVRLENPELAPWAMLLDAEGGVVKWDEGGYQEELDCLNPGESWARKLVLGVLPGAPGYRKIELAVELELGQLLQPDQTRARHCRSFPVRIAQAYEYNAAADILLVVNHATTAEELAAWIRAAARLEQTLAVWDISLNDSLSLSEQLAHGDCLLRDFHGRTMVLINAPFRTSLGTRYGDQFLSQMDLINAAESHGIRVLVVNDQQHDIAHLFTERLVPTDGEPDYRYDSLAALEKAQPLDDVDVLFEQVDELIEHGAQAARPDPTRQTSEVDLYGVRSPSATKLKKQAERLQRKLQSASPGRRVVVMYRLPAERSAAKQQQTAQEQTAQQPPRSGWFFTHDFQGTLSVMPTLGDAHPNLVVVSAGADEIHSPAFVQGPAVSVALVQSLEFDEKIYLLSSKLRPWASSGGSTRTWLIRTTWRWPRCSSMRCWSIWLPCRRRS